jgi:hypothetical protein
MSPERCESCGRWQITNLIDFNDGGRVFAVCDGCAIEARDRGCLVLALDADGQVMLAIEESGL